MNKPMKELLMMNYLGDYMEDGTNYSSDDNISSDENLRNIMYWATERIDELYKQSSEESDRNALAITEEFFEWIGDDVDPDFEVWTL